ncbi:hypothetical protein PLIIFM63780_004318 [Purpureocillium lilacinum]|uniref:uncharacterized protein n=1 Tax=Purpureocillium lilacinum TaxID=33203 RepID=UPI002087AAB0|nr:hypothetical protein PLICBS_000870 [Purpureocillium lilacinum]GJN80788.1 hypothetical protein PLIIFM63780_004318 [Purpureocillium lilacinum]
MSSNAVTTIKEQYDGVVARLEAMATDAELLEARPDDGIFLDDMLLRLKLWAADVQYAQGSLAWAEKMTHVSVPLRERVQELDHQCGIFEAASGRKGAKEKINPDQTAGSRASSEDGRASAKRDLRQAVDNLVAFTTPIKVAASVPEAERTAAMVSRVNQQAEKPAQAALGNQSQYTLLTKPLGADQVDSLLGAVVVPEELVGAGDGPDKPSPVRIPRDSARARVEQSTIETFGTRTRQNRVAEAPAASTRLGAGLREGEAVPRTASYGSTTVRKWQLSNADAYFESFVQAHRDDLKKLFARSPDANIALVSVVLTARVSDLSSPAVPSESGQDAAQAPISGGQDVVDHLSNDVEQVFAFGCLKISAGGFSGPKLSKQAGGLKQKYHLVPRYDMAPPPDGRLGLGSILSSIDDADHPIVGRSPIPITSGEMREQSVVQATFVSSKQTSSQPGVFAKFLNLMGAEIDFTSERSEETAYKFDRLETVSFTPTASYLEQTMALDDVRAYMEHSRFKASCYLVTGLKIARGAAVIQKRRRVVLSADMKTALGLPATVGVGPTATQETTESTAFDGSNDFIFAIRVSKIRSRKSSWLGTRSAKLTVEDYTKGALIGP